MIKQECSTSLQGKSCHNSKQAVARKQEESAQEKVVTSKGQSAIKLMQMPSQERYLALKIQQPGLARTLREVLRRIEAEPFQEITSINKFTSKEKTYQSVHKLTKNQIKTCHLFLESLILISDGQCFHDSIGFDFHYIEHPEKLFDLLSSLQCISHKLFTTALKLSKATEGKTIGSNIMQCRTKEELSCILALNFKTQLVEFQERKKTIRHELEEEKHRKREFVAHWKSLSQERKKNLLHLGKTDSKELLHLLVDRGIIVNPLELQKDVAQLMHMEKPNEFCNRIFRCKIKKSTSYMIDYYELLYNEWKYAVEKTPKKKSHRKAKISFENKKQHQQSRNRSVESNQTTNTEHDFDVKSKALLEKESSFTIHKLFTEKMNSDIENFDMKISREANQYHQRRVITFERLQFLFELWGIPIKLFGSCASGITLRNSDIDIAIDNMILNCFCHGQTQLDRLKLALEWVQSIIVTQQWVISTKLIKGASIPVLKLTVNTQAEMAVCREDYRQKVEYLNRDHNKGELEVDITVETLSIGNRCTHLGIISTQQINEWLESVSPLRSIVIILKHYLMKRQLNMTYKGGLNSYSLIVMIVAFIYHRDMTEEANTALVFQELLKFYGCQFDYQRYKVDLLQLSVNKPIFCLKSAEEIQAGTGLEIGDPLNKGRNMTANCHLFPEIRQILREVYRECFEGKEEELDQLVWKLDPKGCKHLSKRIQDITREFGNSLEKVFP